MLSTTQLLLIWLSISYLEYILYFCSEITVVHVCVHVFVYVNKCVCVCVCLKCI